MNLRQRNFYGRRGLYKRLCTRRLSLFVGLCLLQAAWTNELGLLATLDSEWASGDRERYPSLAYQTGMPYASAALDWQATASAFWSGVSLNSGRLYFQEPTSYATTLDNRDAYFIDQVWLGARNRLGEWTLGRRYVDAAQGQLSYAAAPALTYAFSLPRRWRLSGQLAKPEPSAFFDPGLRSYWLQQQLQWQNDWWLLQFGQQLFLDYDDALAELLNPLWPLMLRLSRYCREAPRACLSAFGQADGFLQASQTRLASQWLEVKTYTGPVELALFAALQVGASQLTSEPLLGRTAKFSPRHLTGAFKASALWVRPRAELGCFLLFQSGDDNVLDPKSRQTVFLGTLANWQETAIFQGGINSDMQAERLQTPGRLAHGLLASAMSARLFAGDLEWFLQAAPLWAAKQWNANAANQFAGARFYGLEFDNDLFWRPKHWLTLSVGAAWLGGGNFPAPIFGQGDWGIAAELLPPSQVWLLRAGMLVAWERQWD